MSDIVRVVSVLGLGKLGAPLAACLGASGYDVIGVDQDEERVGAFNNAKASVFEPGLPELLTSVSHRIRATRDVAEAVQNSDATFIVVPTPSDADGRFSLRHVEAACEAIGRGLRRRPAFHLVVVTSTVMPGSMTASVWPSLERASRKRCGVDFGLCYSPEFVALGRVIRDMLNPDFVLIGESDHRAGDVLESLYRSVCENAAPIVRTNFVNAEVIKLALNAFVTMKITFGNLLARLCEQLSGANVDVVTGALGLDNRIGAKYLKGAIGYGGPCFPRDNRAFAALAREFEVPAFLATATDAANQHEGARLAVLVLGSVPTGGRVGILGLAYKPNTDVVEESQGLLLALELSSKGVPVVAYDPAAMAQARRYLSGAVSYVDSVEACVRETDVLVITTAWDEFRILDDLLREDERRRTVIDCWRILRGDGLPAAINYVPLGIGALNSTR